MSNKCNICLDEGEYFIKICQCNESRICTSCLVELNFHNHYHCPLCRRQLNIETIINNTIRLNYNLLFITYFHIINRRIYFPCYVF